MPHLDAIVLQIRNKLLTLRGFPCAIQALKNYQFAARHGRIGGLGWRRGGVDARSKRSVGGAEACIASRRR